VKETAMLPHLYEFEWTAGHLIFLSVFGVVAATLVTTVAFAAVRAWKGGRG
jgi:hypothetical protein